MEVPVLTLNASTWSYESNFEMTANKGGPGQTTPLTTWVALVRGDDSLKVLALVGSGWTILTSNPPSNKLLLKQEN